ncbi:hypothetical protein ACEQ8H_008335 [Pleosporales sp. CAS-2024a]
MDPLSLTASVIAVLQLSAKVLLYLNDVKDASNGRIQCAIEASNLHNLLTNLRFRLEEGQDHQPWFTAVRELGTENGPLDQYKQALETLQARVKKIRKFLAWPFEKKEIDTILARMERLKALVQIALENDHFKLSQAIKDDTSSIRTHASTIQNAINEVQQQQITETQRNLLQWLSSSDYPAQKSDIIKRRQEGTGQWFLDAPELAQWLNGAKSNLFCPGIPGAGKTVVAAVAIDELLRLAKNDTFGVAYVYCNYKSQAEQDITSVLSALLKQLVQAQPSTIGPVEELHRSHDNRGTKPTLDDVYNALRDVVAQYSHVHIVVDALDECNNERRMNLCTKLFALQNEADVRLMVTSRPAPDIEDTFRSAQMLEIRASDADVRRFVAGQILRMPSCIQRDAVLLDLVQDKVAEAAGGMFLLARLYVDSISELTTIRKVKAALNSLSKGEAALSDAYNGALERIESQPASHVDLAKSTLAWITFAKRPLTTAEIRCALAIEPGDEELDPENKPDVNLIISVCAGLVVVDHESAIVRLVHYTTQDFFEKISSKWDPDGQLRIAEACLTYLSFNAFESGSVDGQEHTDRLCEHEFLEYASIYCAEHVRCVEAGVADLACGHEHIVGLLLKRDADVNVQNEYDEYGESPLYGASRNGHRYIVELLLDKGAHVNVQDMYGKSPFHIASRDGHQHIVELLLDRGADINAQAKNGWSALQEASQRGDTHIVELLLNRGADVNAQDKDGWSALQRASACGYEQVVGLLLDRGADINIGGECGTALQKASEYGHEQIVRLLLDRGADINAQDKDGWSALQEASANGHEQIVGLLLDRGADINMGGECGTALQKASAKGYKQIVGLLLDRGADINAYGRFVQRYSRHVYYGSALQIASLRGHESTVKLLLDRGADINMAGEYGTALQIASQKGYESIVRLLRERGAIEFESPGLLSTLRQWHSRYE